METTQRLLKELIENPEPELRAALEAADRSEHPSQYEDSFWLLSRALGRAALEKRLEQAPDPPHSTCPHCSSSDTPDSDRSGASPP